MKKLISILSIFLLIGSISANAQENKSDKEGCCDSKKEAIKADVSTNDVIVYYFHATRRCATCEAVEAVTKSTIDEYYNGKVPFKVINREEEKENPLISKYKVSGQTLLIIKGDKVVNLTTDAFMNARTNPDKLKAKIKNTVDSMI